MLVYRVEKDRLGPYAHYAIPDMGKDHTDSPDHPPPHRDKGIERGIFGHEVCGFSSIDGLKAWFKGYRSTLKKRGFKIGVYEAEEYKVGTYQVLFTQRKARLVKTLVMR
jgi:ribosome modulation factor